MFLRIILLFFILLCKILIVKRWVNVFLIDISNCKIIFKFSTLCFKFFKKCEYVFGLLVVLYNLVVKINGVVIVWMLMSIGILGWFGILSKIFVFLWVFLRYFRFLNILNVVGIFLYVFVMYWLKVFLLISCFCVRFDIFFL